MYIIDFFKRLTRKANIPVIIYLVLNIVIITSILNVFLASKGTPIWKTFLLGLVIYLFSLVVALSPIGEWILRKQNGCKEINRVDVLNYINPLFQEVYEKARALDPSIPEGVQIYMSDDEAPNAFATGRKTICITEGLLIMPTEQIKATLGHEFGHLAHKDTDLILVVCVGNLIVSALILGIRVCVEFFHFIFEIFAGLIDGGEGGFASLINSIYHAAITVMIAGLTWLWTKIGVLLVMKSSRSNEFEADEFSFRLGYGRDLSLLLDRICDSNAKGLFANLASSHPDKKDRIAKLAELESAHTLASQQIPANL